MLRFNKKLIEGTESCAPGPPDVERLSTSKRVSVQIGSRAVPLFPSPPVMGSKNSPWTGLILERHHHGTVAIPEHDHATFCLHLQTSRTAALDWHSSGKTGHVTSGAGNLIFLVPGTRDSLLWHGDSQRIVASIDPLLMRDSAEQIGLRSLCDFETCWSFEDMQLAHLLTEMDREMASSWAMGSLYGDLLSMSLSIALIKKYGRLSSLSVSVKGGLSRPRLKQVRDYIDENLHRDLRLKDLAALTGLSVFHFARSFRESSGLTPYHYIVQRRVDRAKSLLLQPEWTIEQVASAAGFSGGSQFSRIFRQTTGVTPSTWRRTPYSQFPSCLIG